MIGLLLFACASPSSETAAAATVAAVDAGAVQPAAPDVDPAQADAPPAEAPRAPGRFTLLGAGDVIPHDPVKLTGERYGYATLFAEIAETVRAADVAIVNLETPIAPVRDGKTMQKVFNAPVELAVALRDAGFDGASLANNHVWDQSRAGLLETVANLDQIGLKHAGAGRTCDEAERAEEFVVHGVRVAWLSTTRIHNLYLNQERTDPCVFKFDLAAVLARVAAARAAGADLVVLSVHWGVEYQTTARSWDEAFAQTLVAGGVDVLFGHHPHVLQRARWVDADGRRGVFIMSMGNLMAAQGWDAGPASGSSQALRRDGGLFEVVVEHDAAGVRLASARFRPTWIEHRQTGCRGGPSRMRAVLVERAVADPNYAGCGYERRLPIVRRIIGAEFVPTP